MDQAIPSAPALVPESLHAPTFYAVDTERGRANLATLLRESPWLHTHDHIHAQLTDLIKTRHPGVRLAPVEIERLLHDHLSGRRLDEYGVWVHYPWSDRVVHILGEREFVEMRTNRNRNKITSPEQARLSSKRIGVVGLSVGQSVALTLTLERSYGELRLADFDRLDLSNLNRIRTGVHNIGLPKVYATAREIAEIDPYLRVRCFPDGVTAKNCAEFLEGLDVLVEECDSLDIKVLVRVEARARRIPVVMDTSDRGMIDVERFDLEPDRPVFHGLMGEIQPEQLAGLTTEQKIPFVLEIIGADTMSRRMRASLVEIDQTISTWPQLASAVAHGGACAADVVRRLLLGEPIASGRSYVDIEDLVPAKTAPPSAARPYEVPPPLTAERMMALVNNGLAGSAVVDPAVLERIVRAAVTAPSGGNCQPWKWLAGGAGLYLFHDASRSRSLLDFDDGGAMVALGAALENAVLAAHHENLSARVDVFPVTDAPELVARLALNTPGGPLETHAHDALYPMVTFRHTNRRLSKREPLAADELQALANAGESVVGASVQWLTTAEQLDECAALVGAGDRIRLLTRELNRHLMSEIRWTREEAETSGDGISTAELALSASEVAALRICRDWPSLKLVREWNGGHAFEKMSHKSIAAASAVGLLTMPASSRIAYVNGGRAVQRLWLTATSRHLALQPMTALPYLFARVTRGHGQGFEEDERAALALLYPRFRALFPSQSDASDIFLFRISRAAAVEVVSCRRSFSELFVTQELASDQDKPMT